MVPKNLLSEIPEEYKGQNFYNHLFMLSESIKGIPEKYINSELFNYYADRKNKTGQYASFSIEIIPEEYRTQEMYRMAMYVQPKKYFSIVPRHLLTQGICDIYFHHTYNLEDIPEEFINQNMCNIYFKKTQNIESIPKEYINPGLFEYYIHNSNNPEINVVPEEYRTQEIYEYLLLKGILNINDIPEQKLNQNMCNISFNKTHNLKEIPGIFINQQLFDYYFNKIKRRPKLFDIEIIPHQFRTQEMYNIYFLSTLSLRKIPTNFLNQELFNYYFSYSQNFRINLVPKEFRTQEMYISHFNNTFSLDDIPEDYINQNMCNRYFNKTHIFKKIPAKFVNQQLFDYYFNRIKRNPKLFDIEIIPHQFRTQEMCNIYYLYNQNKIKSIPEENINEELISYVASNDSNFNLKSIPDNLLTQQMCNVYLTIRKNLADIPEQFINNDLFYHYFSTAHDLEAISLDNISDEMINILFEIDQNFFEKLSKNSKEKIIMYELKKMTTIGGTKEQIQMKYNISSSVIDLVIEKCDQQLKEKIEKILKRNSNIYIISCIEGAEILENIIISLGNIEQELTKEQKIKFAYLLGTSKINRSVSQIYSFITRPTNNYSEKYPNIISFCKYQLGYKYKEMERKSEIELCDDELYMARNASKWLRTFDIEKQFHPKNGFIPKIFYPNAQGKSTEIDEQTAQIIINTLRERNIPIRNCIVKEAFRRYALNELYDFIDEINEIDITRKDEIRRHNK